MRSQCIDASFKRELTNEQVMAHRARCRMQHANKTPEQRDQRRKRQRLYNQVPSRKEAMKVAKKRSREVRTHTLNNESIAMENPLFNPIMEWPTANSSMPAHGPTVSPSDWAIPESATTPICFPQAPDETNEDDDGRSDISPGHMTHRQNIPCGQRHALLTRRNNVFERLIGQNTGKTNKEGEDNVEENTPLPQSTVTNNGK
jgi:hypothetical protein